MAEKIASAFDGEKKLPLRLCYEMGFSKEILDLVSNANPNAEEFMFGKMRDKFPTGNPMNNNQDLQLSGGGGGSGAGGDAAAEEEEEEE